jgi:iron-sulfur cluster insertion protein
MLETMTETAQLETMTDFPSPIQFSESAALKVKDMIVEEGNPKLNLRVYVTGGGCSGFQYGFAFDESLNEDDNCIEKHGVMLVVDAVSFQ